jgi:hypothetical protein
MIPSGIALNISWEARPSLSCGLAVRTAGTHATMTSPSPETDERLNRALQRLFPEPRTPHSGPRAWPSLHDGDFSCVILFIGPLNTLPSSTTCTSKQFAADTASASRTSRPRYPKCDQRHTSRRLFRRAIGMRTGRNSKPPSVISRSILTILGNGSPAGPDIQLEVHC